MNTISRLTRLAELVGLDSSGFDDLVHDLAQEEGLTELNELEQEDEQEDCLSSWESYASDINNGGLESQLLYLLNNNDEKWLIARIKELAVENLQTQLSSTGEGKLGKLTVSPAGYQGYGYTTTGHDFYDSVEELIESIIQGKE